MKFKSIAVLGLLTASLLQAAPVYFTSRAAFNAAAGALSFESFETSFATAATQTFAGFTVSETNGTNALAWSGSFPFAAPFVTHGNAALWFDDNNNSIGTFFNFTSPVNAFGLDVTTDGASTVSIGGGSLGYNLVLSANTPAFFGVIDLGGLSSVTFDASGGPNIGFDAVSYGSVPDHSNSVLLVGAVLSALACVRRRFSR